MAAPTIYDFTNDGYLIPDSARPARISPLDQKQGKEVYLIPKNATAVAPPSVPGNKRAKFDRESQTWSLDDLPNTTLTTTARINLKEIQKQVVVAFPNVGPISSEQDTEEEGTTKTILFPGVPNSSANIAALEGLITAHVFADAKLEGIKKERSSRLYQTDWIMRRHEDQLRLVEAGLLESTTLDAPTFQSWLQYRQQLRDFPTTCNPLDPVWPTEPT